MSGAVRPVEPAPVTTVPLRVPDVFVSGRWTPAAEIERMARRWRIAALHALGAGPRVIAAAPTATSEGVALVLALSALPVPALLIDPDPDTWRRIGGLPPDTPLLLPPSAAHLQPMAPLLSARVTALAYDAPDTDDAPFELFSGPGIVLFTSGSTGAPKPVFRSSAALVGASAARVAALGLAGGGILAGASIAHGRGLSCLVTAALLGGPFGLLGPLNHRAALAALARPEFACWWASAHFADVLGRCETRGLVAAPPCCLVSSPISRRVFDRFRDRFGVPLRQTYSSSETGCISVDASPAAAVRPDTVGRPVAGLELRVGEHPSAPLPSGVIGRLWVRSSWTMAGYGIPPHIEAPHDADGWLPTRDMGAVDDDGYLTLAGRLDDCIRTREGRLVNLAAVARQLDDLPGVSAAVVVPLEGAAGASFGAVVEADPAWTPTAIRTQVASSLPAWARPRALAIVEALPRLANGKPDRLTCHARLAEHEP